MADHPHLLEELPLECWVCIAAQSTGDRQGLLCALPLVSRRLRDTLHEPWVRCSILRAIYGDSSASGVAVSSDGTAVTLTFKEQLKLSADRSRWQQLQIALMRSAIQRGSLRTVKQTLADGLHPQQPDALGVTPLYLAMKHNFAAALEPLLLGVPQPDETQPAFAQVQLPAPESPPRIEYTQMNDSWDPAFVGGTVQMAGHNLLQLTRAGVDTPGCCPLLTGVLHHSVDAVSAMLKLLLSGRITVRVSNTEGDRSDQLIGSDKDVAKESVNEGATSTRVLEGTEYVKLALEAGYKCAATTEITMPHFMCGTAFGHFSRMNPRFPALVAQNNLLRSLTWGLLELELRRPDLDVAMLQLLASAHAHTGAVPSAGYAGLVTIIALKASLCREQLRGKDDARVGMIGVRSSAETEDALRAWPGWTSAVELLPSVAVDAEVTEEEQAARDVMLGAAAAELQCVLREGRSSLRVLPRLD